MGSKELTVACVLVRGNVNYTVEYVERLHAMCRRYIDRPFEFACLTDQPRAMPQSVRAVPILKHASLKGWWAKVGLFKPDRFTGRVLYLDLDTLLLGPLDEIIDYPEPFALVPDAGTFNGSEGLRVVKRYNSSVMVWDAQTEGLSSLYTDWRPDVAQRLWGDQDWIGEHYPHAATMPLSWFPRLSTNPQHWPTTAKVVLCKVPKNVVARELWPWFAAKWG